MRRFALTEQPKIRTRLLTEGDEPTKDLIGQLAEMHGVGAVVQTEDGNFRAVRLNTTSNALEVRSGGVWVGVGAGAAADAADYTITGTVNQITADYTEDRVLLGLPQDIHTGASPTFAGLRLSGLSSELLKVGATGVLAEAVEGTDYAGIDYANVFTAAQTININSTTALLVEQNGVKDNTFVVDTTNAAVGIGAGAVAGTKVYVVPEATDTYGFYVKGDTNAYTGSTVTYGGAFYRTLAAGCSAELAYAVYAGLIDATAMASGGTFSRYSQYNNITVYADISGTTTGTYAPTGLLNYLFFHANSSETSTVNQTITATALYNELITTAFVVNKGGGTLTWTNYGLRNVFDNYDSWGGYTAGAVTLTNYGVHTVIPMGNNQAGATGITVANYGSFCQITGAWGSDAGYPCANYGYYADCQNGSVNYAFYSAAGDWIVAADNQKIWFGGGQDATIYYDGTDLIVNSDDVGTGGCKINALNVRADGTVQPVTLADGDAANVSIYYSSTQSKLVYKDSGGTVNDLY